MLSASLQVHRLFGLSCSIDSNTARVSADAALNSIRSGLA